MEIKGLKEWAKKHDMLPENSNSELPKQRILVRGNPQEQNIFNDDDVPRVYRAQIEGRCNLHYAGDNPERSKWKKEWMRPTLNQQPQFQYKYDVSETNEQNCLIHSLVIRFPDRVFSDSGQDSIARPVLDAYGIPFIPGSSIKGIFKRLLNSQEISPEEKEKVKLYCGSQEKQGILRFYGAYPIGNWANRMVDLVHPQQAKQVENNESTSASALISFYQPKFIFEFSISNPKYNSEIDWNEFEKLLHKALEKGLGGKTSTGYGFAFPPGYANPDSNLYKDACHICFHGKGIKSVLLEGQSEFRSNLFKATIRGHIRRLLAGVRNSKDTVEKQTNYLLGSTDSEGVIQLFWKMTEELKPDSRIYDIKGILHIAVTAKASLEELEFIKNVLKFAYVMGGFGKSWRRVWHKDFYHEPNYKKQIGCHWESDEDWLTDITNQEKLSNFLDKVEQSVKDYLNQTEMNCLDWRESWHRDRLAVYSDIVTKSQAIALFHEERFKTTPAIGGRKPNDEAPTSVSCVWHRMLPIDNEKYLEIVTVFHGGKNSSWRNQWNKKEIVTISHGGRKHWKMEKSDQLVEFTNRLKQKGLQLTWGTLPQN